ncbi:MAG: sugar phosphate isomerase/epimerase family protein [Phycisphaerales bacterium]
MVNRPAVCSWSLQPTSPVDLVDKIRACGVSAVQLHLDPIRSFEWRADETGSRLREAGIRIVSGMMSMKGEDYTTLESIKITGGVRPDATWEDNLKAAEGNAILAARLGLKLVTFHAGFLPHERGDAERRAMIERLRKLAEVYGARNVRVAFETGQESAETLLDVLQEINGGLAEHQRVGVNFDPANMILYGMGDPISALKKLMPYVVQVHIKDATPAAKAGEWGAEVVVGAGKVDWKAFFGALRESGFAGDMSIEREAGDTRVKDVAIAREFIATI